MVKSWLNPGVLNWQCVFQMPPTLLTNHNDLLSSSQLDSTVTIKLHKSITLVFISKGFYHLLVVISLSQMDSDNGVDLRIHLYRLI